MSVTDNQELSVFWTKDYLFYIKQ